jgi:PAS domain S-box-containing protein
LKAALARHSRTAEGEQLLESIMSNSSIASNADGRREFLAGGGEMGERIREFDWGCTPLGPPEGWPQSLKAAVTLCLGSRMPLVIWWDRDQAIQFYNDAYISFLGPTKHPAYLGRSGRECWQEIWETMGPLWDQVFGSGEATWSEDFLYVINRTLPREEGYFTFSYSPIRGDAGSVDGLFGACYETTGKVVGARRLETLRRLGEQAMEADSVADACARAEAVLRENAHDIPFARIYRLDSSGHLPADAIAPTTLASVLQTRRPADVSGLELLGGAWPEPATQAVVLPLFFSTHETMAGLLVLGVSPRRPLDAEYRTFFDLIAGHVSTAMTNARSRVQGNLAMSFIDLTDRMQAEEALRAAEELARQRLAEIEDLYHNAPVGLCVLDRSLRFLRINERLAEINGIPAADHIGKTVREVLPGLADAVEPEMRRILETGEPWLNIEIASETPAHPGLQRSWLEQWLPIKDSEGRVTGLSIVVEEITERKKAGEVLERERKQLWAIIESLDEAVGVWNTDGSLVLINDATAKLYGFEVKEQMLKRLSDYADVQVRTLDGRELPQEEWPPARVLRGETFSNWELEQYIPSIKKRFIGSNSGRPVRDANGKIILGVTSVRDITEAQAGRGGDAGPARPARRRLPTHAGSYQSHPRPRPASVDGQPGLPRPRARQDRVRRQDPR